uniref:G-protein coupled receptors family 1 profile domain-containing protein n=1 Tax=Astyanax mexicanus TaxID=7994 RepID=A0A3B1JT82_ASTMX
MLELYNVSLNEGPITKLTVVLLMSLFFIYLNMIMLYSLMSKRVFIETPRYILFAHMLLNDSIHLLFTAVLYCVGLALLKLVIVACALTVFVSSTTFRNAPLNLAVMSLERYIAICFPLRHAEIATRKRTYLAIVLIWSFGSINFMIDLFYRIVMDPNILTTHILCTREALFLKAWQLDVFSALNILYFVGVSLIIIFTYLSIMISARSVSSNKDSATKAHRTVLLHFVHAIERAAAMLGNSSLYLDVRYLAFLFILVLPRCMSPLIYGLRDNALKPLFIYYFRCGSGTVKFCLSKMLFLYPVM